MLHERAILVTLSLGSFSPTKKDKQVTDEVLRKHGADPKAGRFTKRILPEAALQPIGQLDDEIYKWNRKETLPWNDDGTRLLPSASFMDYMAKIREFKRRRQVLKDTFVMNYRDFVDDARLLLNGLFNEADYPAVGIVEQRFTFKMDTLPVPGAGDFRVKVGQEIKDEVDALEASMAERLNEAADRARRELFQRMAAPLVRMAESLGDASKELTLRTTNPIVRDLREIIDMIPRLNLTGDPDILILRQRMQTELAGFSAEVLKESDVVRTTAARKAQNILDAMEGFMGAAA